MVEDLVFAPGLEIRSSLDQAYVADLRPLASDEIAHTYIMKPSSPLPTRFKWPCRERN